MASKTKYIGVSDVEVDEHLVSRDDEYYETSTWTACTEDGWLYETISLLLGCSLMLGLCELLRQYDGKSVPNLGASLGTTITLNTITAILGTAIQACLLYPVIECIGQLKWQRMAETERNLADIEVLDKATRGSWGSLLLVCKLRWNTIASLGGLIVISAITITPLFQQLISITPQQVQACGKTDFARLSVLQRYSERYIGQNDGIDPTSHGDFLSSGLSDSIYAGLYQQSTTILKPPAPDCSSGNCTFGPYQSLAICPRFQNITSHVLNDGAGTSSYYRLRNLTVDNNGGQALDMRTFNQSESLAFTDVNTTILHVVVLDSGMNTTSLVPGGLWACEFLLQWCVQNYSTDVIGGIARTQTTMDRPIFPSMFTNHTQGFAVDITTAQVLTAFMSPLFSGNMWDSKGNLVPDGNRDTVSLIFQSNMTALENIVNNLAISMSNYLRSPAAGQFSDSASHTINGTVWQETTIVVIRWHWVIGPALFAGFAISFFVICMLRFHTGTHQLPAWKSSGVSMLHAMGDNSQGSVKGLSRSSQMRSIDENTSVQLQSNMQKTRWRLVPNAVQRYA